MSAKDGVKLESRFKLGTFASMILLAAVAGVVAGATLLPLAYGLNQFKDVADNAFNDIETDQYNNSLSTETIMYAADGTTEIAKFYAQDRIVVPLDKISKNLQNAVIAREDKRFYEHDGIDAMGMVRGFFKTYSSDGADTQGGSTITQQYVKNLLIDNALQEADPIAAYHAKEQTIYRKLKEAKSAFDIEKKMSKEQILEGYLNVAPFGPNVYGAQSSSKKYFNKDAKDLSIAEAALIAGTTKSPVMYDPLTYPEEAVKQRNIVLDLMLEQNFITKEQHDEAVSTKLADMLHVTDVPVGCQSAKNAAFFCDYVVNQILHSPQYGITIDDRKRFLYQSGLKIYTTLNMAAQNAAAEHVVDMVPADDKSGMEDVLVTVEPGTGKVIAMAQNRPYNGAQTDPNAIDTAVNYAVGRSEGGSNGFSPGSSIKLVVLVDWLRNGHGLYDSLYGKIKYPFIASQFACAAPFNPWTPKNYNGDTGSSTPLNGFNQSLNIPMIQMAGIDGMCSWGDTAKMMGIVDELHGDISDPKYLGPAMVIGTENVSPLTMANSYATVASGGIHCSPVGIVRIVDQSEKEYEPPSANCERVLDEKVANTAFWALKTNVTQGVANQARISGWDVGAKTGTSENEFHLWTLACVVQACTAGWVGNAQGDVPLTNMSMNGRYMRRWTSGAIAQYLVQPYMKDMLQATGAQPKPIPDADKSFLTGRSYASDDAKDSDPTNPNHTCSDEDKVAGRNGCSG
ncbi:MAG: penicillin-binding protein [Candidatus Ancillula sp.]|jgi:membrane peptidoglycan carboxypeptidase|nr:penicillin-binding protein [Candidatus Ancillula sp.]